MNTHFAFIDETGAYRKERDERFLQRCPYYLKACLLLRATRWKELSRVRKLLAQKYGLPVVDELKWNHLWKLRKRDVKREKVSYKADEEFLRGISFDQAERYAQDFLGCLPGLEPLIICTITVNGLLEEKIANIELERMHFQDIMQRIEMEMASRSEDSLAVLFADENAHETEDEIEARYHQLFHDGDLIQRYEHIMDSMSFLHSHQCCGLQMVDFIAGAVMGFLRGYEFSKSNFALSIYERLRRGRDDKLLGYGIVDVPKRAHIRQHLQKIFADVLPF